MYGVGLGQVIKFLTNGLTAFPRMNSVVGLGTGLETEEADGGSRDSGAVKHYLSGRRSR